jgi:CRISPR-associated protein Cmr1
MPDDAFPRAEFGLPIVFHFKDGQKKDDRNSEFQDPPESELCPAGSMRMASPIILRPIAFGDGRRGVPLIMRLNTQPLHQVELKVRGRTIHTAGPEGIRNPTLANYRGSPMSGLTATGSALEAFVNFAKNNEFKEVEN